MRRNVNLFNSLYDKYNEKGVNFISIYISEAHADNEWPIRTKKELKIKQHEKIQDRIKCAAFLKEYTNWKMPVYVDRIQQIEKIKNFETEFCSWPLRIFIIDKGLKYKYIMYPDKNGNVDFNEIEQEIVKLMEK